MVPMIVAWTILTIFLLPSYLSSLEYNYVYKTVVRDKKESPGVSFDYHDQASSELPRIDDGEEKVQP